MLEILFLWTIPTVLMMAERLRCAKGINRCPSKEGAVSSLTDPVCHSPACAATGTAMQHDFGNRTVTVVPLPKALSIATSPP
jgi:hypothetical protein